MCAGIATYRCALQRLCLGCKPDQGLRGEAEQLGRLLEEAGDRANCEAEAEGVRRRRQDQVREGTRLCSGLF